MLAPFLSTSIPSFSNVSEHSPFFDWIFSPGPSLLLMASVSLTEKNSIDLNALWIIKTYCTLGIHLHRRQSKILNQVDPVAHRHSFEDSQIERCCIQPQGCRCNLHRPFPGSIGWCHKGLKDSNEWVNCFSRFINTLCKSWLGKEKGYEAKNLHFPSWLLDWSRSLKAAF